MINTIIWAQRAKTVFENIVDFILIKWDYQYVLKFLNLLVGRLFEIGNNPLQFQITHHFTNARKVIIHAHVTLYYHYYEKANEIILFFYLTQYKILKK